MFRQKKAATFNYTFLAGIAVVLTFCGTFLLFHFLSRGHHRSALGRGKRPHAEFQESGQCRTFCYTNECLRTAADMLQLLDRSVDPCQDFYRYACGGYNKVPTEHRKKVLHARDVEDEAVRFFRDLIKQVPKSIPEDIPGYSLIKIRKLYDSCIDTVTPEDNFVRTVFKYLERFGIKGWPELLGNFTFVNPDLDEVLVRLALYKQQPFFEVRLAHFPFSNETGRAIVSEFSPLFEMKIQVAYKFHSIFHKKAVIEEDKMMLIKEILEYFVPNTTARTEILTDVLSFDLALYNLTQRVQDKQENVEQCSGNNTRECSGEQSYDCSQEGNQQMERWCKIAEKILDRSGFLKKNSVMDVLLEDIEYYQDLGLLIDGANQRTIAHALAVQFLVENAFFLNSRLSRKAPLPDEFEDSIRKYVYEMPEMGRSQFCTVWATYRLPILAETAFFASKYNNSKLRKEVKEIYSDIKEISLSTVREEMSWIDSVAKEAIAATYSKLYFMPESRLPYIRNLSEVDELHKEVQITEESFLANELESRKLRIILYFRNMANLTKIAGYSTTPFQFHPQYDDPPRSICIELGSLLFPSVLSSRPRYINLGSFGAIMGHELSHPIVIKTFLEFYENKSEVFENALKEKEECLVNHYSEYEIFTSGQKLKGNLTFHEDMTDQLGIRAAFKSFKKYQESHGYEEMLPGLYFTNEQMFFIAVAQIWCEAHTPEGLEFYIKDMHSPPNTRVLGIYKNFDAFSEAFSCPPGSPMNPVRKCRFE